MGLEEIHHRKLRSIADAYRLAIFRYLLFASLRSGDAAGRNHGGARAAFAPRQGSVRRNQQLLRRGDGGGEFDLEAAQLYACDDPPALLQPARTQYGKGCAPAVPPARHWNYSLQPPHQWLAY